MHFRKAELLIVAISYILLITANAQEFSSDDFKVLNPVLHPGNFSSSDDFRLFGAIGQPAVGQSSSGDPTLNTLKAGFLYFGAPTPAPAPSPSPSPAPAPPSSSGGPILDIFKKILDRLERIIGRCRSADLNCDGLVNIYDAGILFYWWEKPIVRQEFASALRSILRSGRPSPDINSDENVDIFDLSIMLSEWADQ